MKEPARNPCFNLEDFLPSLRQAIERQPLVLEKAILARLERSCRTFSMGSGSRNYIATLRTTLSQEGDLL